MKINDLDQPRVGDIVEFETDPDTVVEGLIVGETDDGYIYEFSDTGYTVLDEATNPAQQAAVAIDKQKKQDVEEAHPNSKIYDQCWDGYKKVPGKKRGESGYCEKVDEAEYHGREVPLGRPMQGDVKKFKVYVKDPSTGNVKKVNFGDPNMRIKKSNPARRRSFRARHNCKSPGPRDKARYWSCRKW